MQKGDLSSSYYPYPQPSPLNPNPNPIDQPPPPPPQSYASAPPFSATSYSSSDYPSYPPNYPSFSQNPDPLVSPSPPTAPFSSHLPPNLLTQQLQPPPPPPPSFTPTFQYSHSLPPAPESQQQPPLPHYPPYDPVQPAPSYHPPPSIPSNPYDNSNASSNLNPSMHSASFSNANSAAYETSSYESNPIFRHGPGYSDNNLSQYGVYGRSRSDLGSDLSVKRPESIRYDSVMYRDDVYGDGVYAYGGKTEPYGARGTAPKSSNFSGMFDDYGRAISFPSSDRDKSSSLKVVTAVPKPDAQTDATSGMQKFRVKLLPESGGQNVMDVLCQVGLDGIRMLEPSNNRTLRIYPLETVTRCEKIDSSTFAFWSKTSVDIEPRRIRLQSNSYATNTILDTVTAAVVQFKEMGGRSRPADTSKIPERTAEKKKGFGEWINLLKPANEEKEYWVPDEAVSKCTACGTDFSAFLRKHHCRNCGDIFCDKCTHGRIALTADDNAQQVRVCDRCMAEVTQRLSYAKEAVKSPALQSHDDLAKKLQDEMEKNRRASLGSKFDGSGKRVKEVACPTCTVHLQVQVPSSGSETIECGVCQHPFIVSSH